jgi:hypothetical protein
MTVYTSKRILPVRTETIPEELKARPQWVVWRTVGDKPDKVPYSVRSGRRASSTDLELPSIGWLLFLPDSSPNDWTASCPCVVTFATRLLTEPLTHVEHISGCPASLRERRLCRTRFCVLER